MPNKLRGMGKRDMVQLVERAQTGPRIPTAAMRKPGPGVGIEWWRRTPDRDTGIGDVPVAGRPVRIGSLALDASLPAVDDETGGGSVLCPGTAVQNYFGPLVIVSTDMRAVSCNEAAGSVLGRADRISVRADGRFSVYPNALDTKLKKIVLALADDPSDGTGRRSVLVCGRSGRPSHVVVASPLVPGTGKVRHVLLTIVEFESSEETVPRPVLEAFGLTDRECEFVGHFVHGCSVDEASCLMGISKNTGRVHLRNVVLKTGARNQVDLLRRIMKFPAMVGTSRFASADD